MRFTARVAAATIGAGLALILAAGPVFACGGLIGPNGAVNLLRTSTLAAWADGEEHYITSFEFAGGEGEFGSIVPLPGEPSKVERGGDWTLQRLQRETQKRFAREDAAAPASAGASSAQVIQEVRIDALDVVILKGGAESIGVWAREHGFRLPPDAPEVLRFYADRSPYFMAARFDANAARERGQAVGDGTPVHLTIPTENPWVPLRILSLGKTDSDIVEADVYLMTPERPRLLPEPIVGPSPSTPHPGIVLERSGPASRSLMRDLTSDKGMEWMPANMWLTHVVVDATAGGLSYDLAVDASGRKTPSTIAAGIDLPAQPLSQRTSLNGWVIGFAAVLALSIGGIAVAVGKR